MAEILKTLKAWLTPSKTTTESYASPLFYKITFGVCITTFIILLGSSNFGDPIECKETDNSHCWKNGTERIKDQSIYSCAYKPVNEEYRKRPKMDYYFWIPWILLLNGALFHIPHRIWKCLERGTIKQFYSEEAANKDHLGAQHQEFLKTITDTFKSVKDNLKWYYGKYVFCQILNIVVLFLIFLSNDGFLHQGFSNYGSQYLHFSMSKGSEEHNQHHYYNPLCDTFPIRTNCYDCTGSTAGAHDCLSGKCEMNHNIVNQYIFLIMWFWYIFLFLIGGLQLIFEAICVSVPAFRCTLLISKLPPCADATALKLEQFTMQQWFLLFQISRNMKQKFFYEFLRRVSIKKYEEGVNEEAIPMSEMTTTEQTAPPPVTVNVSIQPPTPAQENGREGGLLHPL